MGIVHPQVMATSNRFTKCKDPNDVDVELKTLLCCEYLHKRSCKDNFTKFKLKCGKHLKTPAEKQLSNPEDILEKLRAKGIIRTFDYGELKNLVEDIDVDIVALIKEAEERIKSLEEQSVPDSPNSKRIRRKMDDVSSKDDEQRINYLGQRLIKISNDKTRVIPLSPLLERGEDELPIEQLVIQEDPKYKEKRHDYSHRTKVVKNPDDMFTKDGKAVKKIFMTGDSERGCNRRFVKRSKAPKKDAWTQTSPQK